MVDHVALGEEGEGVKQLEDGVARLVDRHDDGALSIPAQTVCMCVCVCVCVCARASVHMYIQKNIFQLQ